MVESSYFGSVIISERANEIKVKIYARWRRLATVTSIETSYFVVGMKEKLDFLFSGTAPQNIFFSLPRYKPNTERG